MCPTKFQVNWPLELGEKAKKKIFKMATMAVIFGHYGGHLGFPISTILAIFYLQVSLMLPTKFGVNWPFSSGDEAKNRFSRWRPPWISDLNDFSYF